MPKATQWFLDVQYWSARGEVLVFTNYREARARCQELSSQIVDEMPQWVHDQSEEDAFAGLVPAGVGQEICAVELSDADGYRVSGAGLGGVNQVDDLVDARVGDLPFVVGKYRIKWLDKVCGQFTRVSEPCHG